MNKLEKRKKRFNDILQRAVAVQKESLATAGYLLSAREIAFKIGETAHEHFIRDRLPKELKPPHGQGLTPGEVRRMHEDDAKMEAIQREATARGGRPLSIAEVAEKMPHRTLHWVTAHYTKLSKELKRPKPTELLDYSHGPPLPDSLQVAAAEVSKAMNQGTQESKAEQQSAVEAAAKKNTNDLMMNLIQKAIEEGKLSCPSHPDAKLVWSCGDPLNGKQKPREEAA